MQRIVILGAGGHAQVVADILLCMNNAGESILPVSYLDDDPALTGQSYLGVPVSGIITDLPTIPHDAVIIGIGSNQIRKQLYELLLAQGEQFAIAQHPTAVIAADVQIQQGSVICANVVVNTGSTIGAHVSLNTGCTVDHHNKIGDYAHIAPGTHLGGNVHIGNGTFIGIGATVMPQREVGNWCQIGAGAVVIHNINDGETAVGIPAKPISK